MICEYRHKVPDSPCIHYCEGGFCKLPKQFRCMEAIYREKIKLSHSAVNSFTACKHRYYLSNLKGIRVRPEMINDAMKLGNLFHGGYANFFEANSWLDLVDKQWPGKMQKDKDRDIHKVFALLEFIQEDGIVLDTEKFINCEYKFNIDELSVTGVIDRLYSDHFTEVKLSSRPEYYVSPHFLASQLATYFLSNPELKYCVMEVVRLPGQKQTGNFEDESPVDYKNRIKADIHKRPAYYFLGYDKNTKRFGRKFYRTEFDLDEVRNRYKHIMAEIRHSIEHDSFYKNESSCLLPYQCDYLAICESGGVSDLIYEYMNKEIKE